MYKDSSSKSSKYFDTKSFDFSTIGDPLIPIFTIKPGI